MDKKSIRWVGEELDTDFSVRTPQSKYQVRVTRSFAVATKPDRLTIGTCPARNRLEDRSTTFEVQLELLL